MEIYDVVKKLVGPIDPVGETNTDNKRFENLKTMTDLMYKLVGDIQYVSQSATSQEHSVSRAGKHARGFFEEMREQLPE